MTKKEHFEAWGIPTAFVTLLLLVSIIWSPALLAQIVGWLLIAAAGMVSMLAGAVMARKLKGK